MTTPFGDFGLPPDAVAWAALILSGIAFGAGLHRSTPRVLAQVPAKLLVAAMAVMAALLSYGYVVFYLRGGPRIVDATTYYLQARALAQGHVTFPIPSPSGSFRGRFLLASPDGTHLSGIFPPGYPAVLALGFLVGSPMLVGPLLGAGIVVATYALARRLFEAPSVALLAAALSTVCATLRYHTADTMSHGWSALLLATGLVAALGEGVASALFAGACAGALVATRPLTGIVCIVLGVACARARPLRLGYLVGAALLPSLLFLVQQRLVTGVWFGSTQLAYYATADGPPGCFRYGFGPGIGCVGEHGDFVRAHLAHGYGVIAALGTTLRRLKMHLADAGNTELFVPVLLCGVVAVRRTPRARLAAIGIALLVVAYTPFYFDGNYPGGGARFYADALPLEHVLLAFALIRFRLARFAPGLALAGFAFHTAYDHEKLSKREGGRPMFEQSALVAAGIHRGLVFVDTDHGFDLGFDPSHEDAATGIVVARRRRDAHDVLLWERLGRPPAYEYEFDPRAAGATPRIVSLPLDPSAPLRVEAEAEWPPLEVASGFIEPSFPPCASAGRALEIHPDAKETATILIDVPVPGPGRYQLRSGWVTVSMAPIVVRIAGPDMEREVSVRPEGSHCVAAEGPRVETRKTSIPIRISTSYKVSLDYVDVVTAP